MTPYDFPIPLIGFCAWSGTGKTTLLKRVLPVLKESGLRVGVVKHAHHDFEVDQPGKDSYELRKAGADQMLVASRNRVALVKEFDCDHEPTLQDTLRCIDPQYLDLVIVEGFKHEHYPKIELCRTGLERPRLYHSDPSVLAVASDEPIQDLPVDVTQLDLNDPLAIARFVQNYAFGSTPELRHVRCHQSAGELR